MSYVETAARWVMPASNLDLKAQLSSAVCLRNAEMEDILVDDTTPKQGWGQTRIHDVLLAKVRGRSGRCLLWKRQ